MVLQELMLETYKNEKDRNDRFFGLTTLLCPNL